MWNTIQQTPGLHNGLAWLFIQGASALALRHARREAARVVEPSHFLRACAQVIVESLRGGLACSLTIELRGRHRRCSALGRNQQNQNEFHGSPLWSRRHAARAYCLPRAADPAIEGPIEGLSWRPQGDSNPCYRRGSVRRSTLPIPPKRQVRSCSDLAYVIANIHPYTLDIIQRELSTVHDHIAGSLNSFNDLAQPIDVLNYVLKHGPALLDD